MFSRLLEEVGLFEVLVFLALVVSLFFMFGAIPELNFTYLTDRVLGAFIFAVAIVAFCFTDRGGTAGL